MSRSMSRSRSRMSMHYDYGRSPSGTVIKFKRKGGFRSGITLGEAMSDAHLSSNNFYTLYDLNADARGRIILKIRVCTAPCLASSGSGSLTGGDTPCSGQDTTR